MKEGPHALGATSDIWEAPKVPKAHKQHGEEQLMTMPEETDASKRALAKVLAAASDIPHTDYIVGRGRRKADGGIQIEEHHVSAGLGEAFVRSYAEYEQYDSAAQQFLCAPFIPISIEVGETMYVDDQSQQSGEMASYLQGFDVDSLLVVGLESSRGICWMTLYRRRQKGRPFSPEEAELASYRVRAALFEWQIDTGCPVVRPPDPKRYRLLPLGRRGLDVAMRRVRGLLRKQIAAELGVELSTVDEHCKRLKELGLTKQAILGQMLGEIAPARPPKDEDQGLRRG